MPDIKTIPTPNFRSKSIFLDSSFSSIGGAFIPFTFFSYSERLEQKININIDEINRNGILIIPAIINSRLLSIKSSPFKNDTDRQIIPIIKTVKP